MTEPPRNNPVLRFFANALMAIGWMTVDLGIVIHRGLGLEGRSNVDG